MKFKRDPAATKMRHAATADRGKPHRGRMAYTSYSVLVVSLGAVLLAGCIVPSARYTLSAYENQALRLQYEEEFKHRALDPIEGFWRSDNEFVEGVGVTYRTDPASNDEFPFANRAISLHPKQRLPYSPDFSREGARLKPAGQDGVYYGQMLMVRGADLFWKDVTIRLLDSTTAKFTVRTSEPVLGGATQRAYLVGPPGVLKSRFEASAPPRAYGSGPTASAGSGFLVAPDLVVTNYHVAADAKTIRCYFAGKDTIDATVLASDRDIDLALLKLARSAPGAIKPLELVDSSTVKQERRVFAMGYQLPDILGEKLSVHEGIVSSVSGLQDRSSQFQVEMNVHPGSSGGPLLDQRGCVLGVVQSKLGGSLEYLLLFDDVPGGIMFAVKADLLRTLGAVAGVTNQLTFSCRGRPERDLEELTELYGSAVVRIEATK